MAPKKNAAAPASTTTSASTTTAKASPLSPSTAPPPSVRSSSNPKSPQEIATTLWDGYLQQTPQRTKLVDAFMVFLMVVGALQFVYCVIAGNYPFNAFLSGFSATVGQFVLTASLRIQTNPANAADFGAISHERAFADFVFGSMILHFFCVNFIN